jgi:hypothetical protein
VWVDCVVGFVVWVDCVVGFGVSDDCVVGAGGSVTVHVSQRTGHAVCTLSCVQYTR